MPETAVGNILRQRISLALFGENGRGGLTSTIISGSPKTIETYRDLCGYVRALHHVLDEWLPEAERQEYGIPNEDEQQEREEGRP